MTDTLPLPMSLEDSLRQSAPQMSLGLKKRTLRSCTVRVAAHQQQRARLNRQMAWAVAAVLALQTMAVVVVDAQTTRLINGNSIPAPFHPITIAEVNELWRQRSRKIAQLMDSPKIG